MSYPIFDLHWHGRDLKQVHKETLYRSLMVAEASGIRRLAYMPNTDEPLTTLERCLDYLKISDAAGTQVETFVNIGLTPDLEQVKRAVEATSESARIRAMKLYMGRSTGDLSIVNKDQQRSVIETLAKEGYDKVLMSHCEKEDKMDDKKYDPGKPRTWSTICRPEEAEIESYNDLVEMAEAVNFKGTIHVCHVSTAYVVDFIHNYQGKLKLSCGITPHHFILSDMVLASPVGAWYKCNPPLRSEETRVQLENRILHGRIPIIESDHAPHTADDKKGDKPASGIACGTAWPYVAEYVMNRGMSESCVRAAVWENASKLFGLPIEAPEVKVDFDKLKKLQASYPFDHFGGMKEEFYRLTRAPGLG